METVGLVLLLLTLPVLFFLTSRARAGKGGDLRSLPGIEGLEGAVARAAETGQPLHVSVGTAGVGGVATSATWAGLTVLSQLADMAAGCETPLIVTVADPTVLPLAQDIVRRACARHGDPHGYDSTKIRFVAPDPTAYAAGVMGLLERESLTSNVMIGSFGVEYMLIGETGVRKQILQVGGTTDPHVLSLVYASADETLVGEEIFASGGYLSRLPIQIGSLLTQDWARLAVVLGIFAIAIYRILA